MDTNQYLEVFIDESNENLQVVNDRLLDLENNPEDLAIVNDIFRAAHTLKGMSATMGYEDLADLTHKLENVLDAIRNEKIKVQPAILDVLFDSVEALEDIVGDVSNGGNGKKDVSSIVSKLQAIEAGEEITNVNVGSEQPNSQTESTIELDEFELTVIDEAQSQGQNIFEVKVELAEDCLLKAARVYMVFEVLEKAGEVIKSIPSVDQLEDEQFEESFQMLFVSSETEADVKAKIFKVSEVSSVDVKPFSPGDHVQPTQEVEKGKQEVAATAEKTETETNEDKKDQKKAVGNKTIRVNIERLDALMNLFEELIIDRGRLEQISQSLEHQDFRETVERMTRTSSELQNVILTMRMVPIDQVFNRFPRMVRNLARDLGKKIDFQIEGAETELDRTVIDEIGDPLVHLIRNAVDHGIEMPDSRTKQGKSDTGHLLLKAYHSGNHVFVEITDDGGGINKDKVLQKALSNGVLTQEQASSLSDRQIFELIMASGFSTADEISDISGRGVGLDVVKNTIESLGGSIEIDSELGAGTTFSIKLPLTLSIISVMLVVLDQETYAIPLSSIIETAVIKKNDIYKAHGREVIDFRGNIVPLIHLKQVFDFETVDDENNDHYSVIIVRKGEQMAGLVVDSFIGQQEIVLKNLGNYLKDIFAISGATILGDGEVALIVDTNALIK